MDIVGHIVKYNSQTSGRDKLCRLFQYTSKLTCWSLEKLKKDPLLVTKLKNLETNLSATRKVMRIGKSFDMVQGALKSLYVDDPIHRLTLTLSKLNQACYLLTDHFIWAGKVGLVETNTKKWARISARFWLITIICSLIRNVYDILTIMAASEIKMKREGHGYTNGNVETPSRSHSQGVGHKPVALDVVKNLSDLVLPLSSLGYIKTSGGFQAVMGIIGSIVGIMVIWNPKLKLFPA